MTQTATVRVMSPEEIAAKAGGQTPYLLWPERSTHFAEREMRLRQLSRGHAMGDFLAFVAELARAQHALLQRFPVAPLPDDAALDAAARAGAPPLPAVDWPRDAAWREGLRTLLADLRPTVPAATHPVIDRLGALDDAALEVQADCLLTGVTHGLDLATAPLVAAALQVYWTHLVLSVLAAGNARGQPFGRITDETLCPCCGSRPVASLTRSSGESLGQRYLVCSLCSSQWHMVRIKCPHCLSGRSLAYQSLQAAQAPSDAGVAAAAIQAETCDDCGHYLKILHTDRDPQVEAVADDLASLTLDLLVAEEGRQRHGVNLMLLFGDPGDGAPDAPAPGSDSGAGD
ncbi:MAG: formate dehydrogenase accessory protein FdhE [Burkholderiales bacterium]